MSLMFCLLFSDVPPPFINPLFRSSFDYPSSIDLSHSISLLFYLSSPLSLFPFISCSNLFVFVS